MQTIDFKPLATPPGNQPGDQPAVQGIWEEQSHMQMYVLFPLFTTFSLLLKIRLDYPVRIPTGGDCLLACPVIADTDGVGVT